MGVKLAIGICSNRHVVPQFMYDLHAMCGYLESTGIKGVNLVQKNIISRGNASALCASRHAILTEAIKRGYTHLLWLDDDSGFPANMLDLLFSHGKSVVGVNTAKKNATENFFTALDINGQLLNSLGRGDLVECSAIGMGVLLIDLSVLKNIPMPYFEELWIADQQDYQSETRYFSRKLRAHGVKLWCDNRLSQSIGHWGDQNFNYQYYTVKGI